MSDTDGHDGFQDGEEMPASTEERMKEDVSGAPAPDGSKGEDPPSVPGTPPPPD